VEDREAVGEARSDVHVGDAQLPRGLRVAVGRRYGGGFLEPHDVLEAGVRQRVEERELGGAGVAEETADTGRPENLH